MVEGNFLAGFFVIIRVIVAVTFFLTKSQVLSILQKNKKA